MNNSRAAGRFPLADVILHVINQYAAPAPAVLGLIFPFYDIDGDIGIQKAVHPADLVRPRIDDASFFLGNSGKNFALATDVEITKTWTGIKDNTTLCLNGYKLLLPAHTAAFNITEGQKGLALTGCGMMLHNSVTPSLKSARTPSMSKKIFST